MWTRKRSKVKKQKKQNRIQTIADCRSKRTETLQKACTQHLHAVILYFYGEKIVSGRKCCDISLRTNNGVPVLVYQSSAFYPDGFTLGRNGCTSARGFTAESVSAENDTLYTRMCLWRRRCRRRQQYRVLLGASATSSSNGLDRFDVVKHQRDAAAEGYKFPGREGERELTGRCGVASRRTKRTSCLTATI